MKGLFMVVICRWCTYNKSAWSDTHRSWFGVVVFLRISLHCSAWCVQLSCRITELHITRYTGTYRWL